MTKNTEEPRDLHARMFERTRELQGIGLDWLHASGIAWIEERIRQWPEGWGEDLIVLIYGDFEPLKAPLEFPSLGIVVHPEKLDNTIIRTAMCVHKATVKIKEKSISDIVDAARRINVFLGACTLVEWGHSSLGWWSWVTHDTIASAHTDINHENLKMATDGIQRLQPDIRRKVDAALYWIREPRNTFIESYRSDLLRVYSAYWNAFECLVEAVNIIRPQSKLSKSKKQQLIDQFVKNNSGELTPQIIEKLYKSMVNPGFVTKATHALNVCFEDEAKAYIDECFMLYKKNDRLYEIRNAINHGDIDAENPLELIRIESRLRRLWMIVWRMFGKLIPFPAPLDSSLTPK